MKKRIIILALFSIYAFLLLTCCKDDEGPVLSTIGTNLPDSLAYAESRVSTPPLYTLRTLDDLTEDVIEITASENLIMRQILETSMTPQGREERAFKAIKLLPMQEAEFIAPDDNFFFGSDINATYTVNDDEYTFTIPPDNRVIKGHLNQEQTAISIPFWALRKKGAGTNATAHYPLDYETFFTTSFFSGDSLVYVQYDVIYELVEDE